MKSFKSILVLAIVFAIQELANANGDMEPPMASTTLGLIAVDGGVSPVALDDTGANSALQYVLGQMNLDSSITLNGFLVDLVSVTSMTSQVIGICSSKSLSLIIKKHFIYRWLWVPNMAFSLKSLIPTAL